MHVWVTRTEPGSRRLAGALKIGGHHVLVQPVLEIEMIKSTPPSGSFAVTVFLSEHAVDSAVNNGWVKSAAVAIGASTWLALQKHDIDAWVPEVATSEGIIDLFHPDVPSSVLIAAGEGGHDALERWLLRHDVMTVKWPLYRRLEVVGTLDTDTSIDAIVVSSAAGLKVVANMWFASRHDAKVPMLVPSHRVATAARTYGFTRVSISGGASEDAVVTALEELVN
jgi:uroporphyrinogen-III synthase